MAWAISSGLFFIISASATLVMKLHSQRTAGGRVARRTCRPESFFFLFRARLDRVGTARKELAKRPSNGGGESLALDAVRKRAVLVVGPVVAYVRAAGVRVVGAVAMQGYGQIVAPGVDGADGGVQVGGVA